MSEKMKNAFDEAYPQEATTLMMYEAGSVAVNAMDCIVPRYRLSAFERGWQSCQSEIDALNAKIYTLIQQNEGLKYKNEVMQTALDRLSRLGNEPHLGNSVGNCIAQEAIAQIKED